MENEKIIRIEENNKNSIKRLDNLEKKIQDISNNTISIKEVAIEVRQMREELSKVEYKVNGLEQKPKKRWDNMINQIISLIVAGIVGYFLSRFGM